MAGKTGNEKLDEYVERSIGATTSRGRADSAQDPRDFVSSHAAKNFKDQNVEHHVEWVARGDMEDKFNSDRNKTEDRDEVRRRRTGKTR